MDNLLTVLVTNFLSACIFTTSLPKASDLICVYALGLPLIIQPKTHSKVPPIWEEESPVCVQGFLILISAPEVCTVTASGTGTPPTVPSSSPEPPGPVLAYNAGGTDPSPIPRYQTWNLYSELASRKTTLFCNFQQNISLKKTRFPSELTQRTFCFNPTLYSRCSRVGGVIPMHLQDKLAKPRAPAREKSFQGHTQDVILYRN